MHPFGIAPGWFPKPEASSEESATFLGVVSVSDVEEVGELDGVLKAALGRFPEPEAAFVFEAALGRFPEPEAA